MPDVRPGPLSVLDKSINRVRRRGPGELTDLLKGRLAAWWDSSDHLVFLVRATGGEPVTHPELTFKEATAADAETYARDIGTDSARTFQKRLSASTSCYLAFKGSLCVHATWVTTAAAWTREIRCYVRPPAGDAYVYESFTRPEARGKGAYPFALANLVSLYGSRAIGRIWVAVEAGNAASFKAVTKAGFEPAFELAYSRRCGRLHRGTPEGATEAPRGFFAETPAP